MSIVIQVKIRFIGVLVTVAEGTVDILQAVQGSLRHLNAVITIDLGILLAKGFTVGYIHRKIGHVFGRRIPLPRNIGRKAQTAPEEPVSAVCKGIILYIFRKSKGKAHQISAAVGTAPGGPFRAVLTDYINGNTYQIIAVFILGYPASFIRNRRVVCNKTGNGFGIASAVTLKFHSRRKKIINIYLFPVLARNGIIVV